MDTDQLGAELAARGYRVRWGFFDIHVYKDPKGAEIRQGEPRTVPVSELKDLPQGSFIEIHGVWRELYGSHFIRGWYPDRTMRPCYTIEVFGLRHLIVPPEAVFRVI